MEYFSADSPDRAVSAESTATDIGSITGQNALVTDVFLFSPIAIPAKPGRGGQK